MKKLKDRIIAVMLAIVCVLTINIGYNRIMAGNYSGSDFVFSTVQVHCENYDGPVVGTVTNDGNVVALCCEDSYASPFEWSPSEMQTKTSWVINTGNAKMRNIFYHYYQGKYPGYDSAMASGGAGSTYSTMKTELTSAKSGTTSRADAPYSSSFVGKVGGNAVGASTDIFSSNNGTTQTTKEMTLSTGGGVYYVKVTAPSGVTIYYKDGGTGSFVSLCY